MLYDKSHTNLLKVHKPFKSKTLRNNDNIFITGPDRLVVSIEPIIKAYSVQRNHHEPACSIVVEPFKLETRDIDGLVFKTL